MPQHEIPHIWTYNGKSFEELDRETLIEALTLTCEENRRLTETAHELRRFQAETFRLMADRKIAGHA